MLSKLASDETPVRTFFVSGAVDGQTFGVRAAAVSPDGNVRVATDRKTGITLGAI